MGGITLRKPYPEEIANVILEEGRLPIITNARVSGREIDTTGRHYLYFYCPYCEEFHNGQTETAYWGAEWVSTGIKNGVCKNESSPLVYGFELRVAEDQQELYQNYVENWPGRDEARKYREELVKDLKFSWRGGFTV